MLWKSIILAAKPVAIVNSRWLRDTGQLENPEYWLNPPTLGEWLSQGLSPSPGDERETNRSL